MTILGFITICWAFVKQHWAQPSNALRTSLARASLQCLQNHDNAMDPATFLLACRCALKTRNDAWPELGHTLRELMVIINHERASSNAHVALQTLWVFVHDKEPRTCTENGIFVEAGVFNTAVRFGEVSADVAEQCCRLFDWAWRDARPSEQHVRILFAMLRTHKSNVGVIRAASGALRHVKTYTDEDFTQYMPTLLKVLRRDGVSSLAGPALIRMAECTNKWNEISAAAIAMLQRHLYDPKALEVFFGIWRACNNSVRERVIKTHIHLFFQLLRSNRALLSARRHTWRELTLFVKDANQKEWFVAVGGMDVVQNCLRGTDEEVVVMMLEMAADVRYRAQVEDIALRGLPESWITFPLLVEKLVEAYPTEMLTKDVVGIVARLYLLNEQWEEWVCNMFETWYNNRTLRAAVITALRETLAENPVSYYAFYSRVMQHELLFPLPLPAGRSQWLQSHRCAWLKACAARSAGRASKKRCRREDSVSEVLRCILADHRVCVADPDCTFSLPSETVGMVALFL